MDTVTIREAGVHELDTAALILARALVNDPALRWVGSAPEPISLPPGHSINMNTLQTLPRHLRILYYLHHSVLLSTRLLKGRILVAVRKAEEGDKIVAVTVWLPPGAKVDGVLTILRSKNLRAIMGTFRRPGGWGLVGFKRLALTYESRIKAIHKQKMRERGIDQKHGWYVIDVATDPDEEGKGYCGKLIRQGLKEIVKDAPVFLDTSLSRNKDIYQHLGFEVTGTTIFGVGEVTADGLPPLRSEMGSATGFTVYTMLKATPNV